MSEEKMVVDEDVLKKLQSYNVKISYSHLQVGKIEENINKLKKEKEKILGELDKVRKEADEITVKESERLGLTGIKWTIDWKTGEVVKL